MNKEYIEKYRIEMRPKRGQRGGVYIPPTKHQEQASSVSDYQRPQAQQKRKPILLRQLQHQLRHLEQINDEQFFNNKDPYINDKTLDNLQTIAKQAVKYDLKEIQKLCKLAIGKRILNIQLKKKKDQHFSKLRKKQKIQLFFRQNRIKRYNYDSLIDKKLKDNTLVVKAYENGKGFIESTARYKDVEYESALEDCNFIKTVKDVNRIFYSNYSSIHKKDWSLTDLLLKIVWIPIVLFVCLSITLPFKSFAFEEVILMILFVIIVLILLSISVKTCCNRPNNNNQIQQTVEEVQDYFQKLNQKSQERGQNIEWICSKDFMYLQVIFHDGFPT